MRRQDPQDDDEIPDGGEIARLRRAFAAVDRAAPAPESCPPGDRLWLAARGDLPPAEAAALIDHFLGCPACAQEWRLALAFEAEGRAGERSVRRTERRPGWRRTVAAAPALAALAAVLLAGLGIALWQRAPGPAAGYRGGDTAAVVPLVPDGATLPRQRFVLRWRPVAGAAAYDCAANTEELEPVASARGLTAPEFQIPESALARLPAGGAVYWQVVPVAADGIRARPGPLWRARLE